MDNLIPNTWMVSDAGRLFYSQKETEQTKVALHFCNLPKIAIWKTHGGKNSSEVSNAERA